MVDYLADSMCDLMAITGAATTSNSSKRGLEEDDDDSDDEITFSAPSLKRMRYQAQIFVKNPFFIHIVEPQNTINFLISNYLERLGKLIDQKSLKASVEIAIAWNATLQSSSNFLTGKLHY